MLKIKKANNTEIKEFIELNLKMFKEIYTLPDEYVFDEFFVNYLKEYFLSNKHTTIISYDNQLPIGCATICYYNVLPTFDQIKGKMAKLMNVYVHKDFRNLGIAKAMIGYLIDDAKENDITEIVSCANESLKKIYHKFGFQNSDEYMVIDLEKQLRERINHIEKRGFHDGCGC